MGSNPTPATNVLCRDIDNGLNLRLRVWTVFFGVRRVVMVRRLVGLFLGTSWWVEGEGAQDFAGGGVDDSDVEVVDEHEDVGSGYRSTVQWQWTTVDQCQLRVEP